MVAAYAEESVSSVRRVSFACISQISQTSFQRGREKQLTRVRRADMLVYTDGETPLSECLLKEDQHLFNTSGYTVSAFREKCP